ncbi:hypothetical protein Y032_0023g868 [Ancylostoma ceylanicum]|uniref:Uncharacterized protein n=1 Tax=Ancylostoma ceylanicum TaxID=53326 RepID=A0A016V058_9BILA|nr:hypothetical protein Y032_0023g868 [Ancylostoma ceylanicum]
MVRVGLLGQSMVQTPGYGSALAKQWRNRQGTGQPWLGYSVNVRVRALLGQAVRKTPGYGSALAKQW